MDEEERAIKIARAMQAGPSQITRDATVAEMDMHGNMSRILRKGSNGWVCTPGNENRIGDPPMCVDRIGMQWFKDIHDRKPRPSITTPGLCYMLCGATQQSNSDALDTTSPAIPIGPHWMVLWPFDAAHCAAAHRRARRGRLDHVRGHALCLPARLRFALGGQLVHAGGSRRVDHALREIQ